MPTLLSLNNGLRVKCIANYVTIVVFLHAYIHFYCKSQAKGLIQACTTVHYNFCLTKTKVQKTIFALSKQIMNYSIHKHCLIGGGRGWVETNTSTIVSQCIQFVQILSTLKFQSNHFISVALQ